MNIIVFLFSDAFYMWLSLYARGGHKNNRKEQNRAQIKSCCNSKGGKKHFEVRRELKYNITTFQLKNKSNKNRYNMRALQCATFYFGLK